MPNTVSIDFSRLREFSDRLSNVNLPKIVLDAEKENARIITRQAIPKIPSLTGNARGSITVTETGKGVNITAGVGVPYFGWLDFGGSVGPNKSVKRPYLRTGRYIWRSFADNRTVIMENMEKAIAAGFEVEGIRVDS